MNKYAVIVAGGRGSRMKNIVPKQFLMVKNIPVLMHTLTRYHDADPDIQLIVVLPRYEQETWRKLKLSNGFNIPHRIVEGGKSRFQSVKNGLNVISENDALVAIHDGVRPFTSVETIINSYNVAAKKGNAVAAVALKDSIREVKDGKTIARDRETFRLIQTPQTFQVKLIKDAFEAEEKPSFTDDASVAEHAGHTINLIEGSYENFKITTPEDLILAEAIVKRKIV
ncbi:2-C-methyl-D-erythritol 4-phosphate cytidylyltransferase [Flammeovirgaceae bacterium SG7u.111]|nr:2-C-methyl-D-erythritol 4-phosphate cytidylyltransferase [Flammeovirgaceae bacterium SG7u.132]WPO35834.1 2-C-methyl-D-erythritol 4-phosphate cytidylyltransferase [Flammeovirgaceae bacterium SG7u.111]